MNDLFWVVVVSIVVGLLFGAIIFMRLHKWVIRCQLIARSDYAKAAEEDAGELLKKKGYRILEKKKRETIITYVNGEPHMSYVEADYLVAKNGKTYVAEVKTGNCTDPTDPTVRRQLLEYDYVYSPDGLLLVDMVERAIHVVDFDFPRPFRENIFSRFLLLATIFLVVFIIAWALAQFRFI